MTTENKILPANAAYTFMTPCRSRGRLHIGYYVFELAIAALAVFGMHAILWTCIGVAMAVHALYRISNMKKLQASCPHCQVIQKGLKENGPAYKCKSCGHHLEIYGTKLADKDASPEARGPVEISPLKTHPDNMKQTRTEATSKGIGALASLLVFCGLMYYFFGGGLDKQAAHEINKIENQVAADAVQQYGIASRNGNRIDKCVQAGFVTAAFLQANDEKMYAVWKGVRDKDCKAAGLPVQ